MDPLEAWEKIADPPQLVKFLGGERYRPKQGVGVTQIVLQRVAVNWAADGCTPKIPAAFLKVDLGIVPGAQQSPEISNWLQDEITAGIRECSTTESLQVDDKVLGVFYHRKLYRGQYVYMVHAKKAAVQEMVASTLLDYKIPVVPWKTYNAATELNTMERELNAFKKTFAKVVGATLPSGDRRSPARRHWEVHGDILKSIADEEYMGANGITSWETATRRNSARADSRHTRMRRPSA
jgi:hypothetical protein